MTQIEVLLLCLLYEKDYYGYDIENAIENKNMREWTEIGFSSIYNSLKKLEQKGLIGSREEKEYGSPKRKVYFIQKDAKVIVLNELKSMLSLPKRVYNDFDLSMAFSNLLPKEDVIKSISSYRENLLKRREHLLKRYESQPELQEVLYLKALFTRPLKLLDAEIEWVNDLLK